MNRTMQAVRFFSVLLLLGSAFRATDVDGQAPEADALARIRLEYKTDIQKGNYYEEALRGSSKRFHNELQWVRILAPWADEVDSDYKHAPPEAIERFRDLKFGLRIHWGVYSMNGSNPSWSLWYDAGQLGPRDPTYPSRGLSNDEYLEYIKRYCTFYQDFNPVGFDPAQWADMMVRSGFQFFVFTAKHHDGFSMFRTSTFVNALHRNPDGRYENARIHYSIDDTPFKRDITREVVAAARQRGLAVGLYFSNPDWMDYDARFSEFNLFRDPTYTRQSDPEGWKRYLMRHREQLRELATNYGRIDILSFDHGLPMDAWPELKETVKIIRRLQPEVMMRDRGIGRWGDEFTPEGWHPDDLYDERTYGAKPWSVIAVGTGRHPGYSPPEVQTYPSVDTLVRNLVMIVSAGGSLQLGFGPGPDGRFDPRMVQIMAEMGDWLRVNGEAIYATRPRSVFREGNDIRFTRTKDHKYVYAMSLKWPGEALLLRSVRARTGSKIYLLGSPQPLAWTQNSEGLTIQLPRELEVNRPCRHAYAWKIEVAAS
jgi:alpha-L-fucosidase